jgi:hypothetical protein
MTRPAQERLLVAGPAGQIEIAIDSGAEVRYIALVCHPHPLFGGSLDNKVAQTLAKALRDCGCAALRPNFRGVGRSAGTHDHGTAETEDMLAVIDYARGRYGELPVLLAGFSFGAYVQTRVGKRLAEIGRPAKRLILVGLAAGLVTGGRSYVTEPVPPDTLLIHGELDSTVRLSNVMEWALPLDLPVVVVPGADHFFHRRLHVIRSIVHDCWKP